MVNLVSIDPRWQWSWWCYLIVRHCNGKTALLQYLTFLPTNEFVFAQLFRTHTFWPHWPCIVCHRLLRSIYFFRSLQFHQVSHFLRLLAQKINGLHVNNIIIICRTSAFGFLIIAFIYKYIYYTIDVIYIALSPTYVHLTRIVDPIKKWPVV